MVYRIHIRDRDRWRGLRVDRETERIADALAEILSVEEVDCQQCAPEAHAVATAEALCAQVVEGDASGPGATKRRKQRKANNIGNMEDTRVLVATISSSSSGSHTPSPREPKGGQVGPSAGVAPPTFLAWLRKLVCLGIRFGVIFCGGRMMESLFACGHC